MLKKNQLCHQLAVTLLLLNKLVNFIRHIKTFLDAEDNSDVLKTCMTVL